MDPGPTTEHLPSHATAPPRTLRIENPRSSSVAGPLRRIAKSLVGQSRSASRYASPSMVISHAVTGCAACDAAANIEKTAARTVLTPGWFRAIFMRSPSRNARIVLEAAYHYQRAVLEERPCFGADSPSVAGPVMTLRFPG